MNERALEFREAAEQGNAEAQFELGLTYLFGPGEPEHLEEAAKWFHKAAEQGCVSENNSAMAMLSSCYFLGIGVPENEAEAVMWLRKAAESGDAGAQCDLAELYYRGVGVPQDESEAIQWLRKAEEQKHKTATNLLQEIASGAAKKEIEGEQKLQAMLEQFSQAAEQGLGEVQYQLGAYYFHYDPDRSPFGLRRNTAEGVKWYRKAAELGHAKAQYALGNIYRYGTVGGVPKDEVEAVKWIRKAAEQGLDEAQYRLGWCYFRGSGVDQDETAAVEWYRKAAKQDYRKAQYELGKCYFEGTGVSEDRAEAVKWLQKVIEDREGDDNMLNNPTEKRRAKELLEKIEEQRAEDER